MHVKNDVSLLRKSERHFQIPREIVSRSMLRPPPEQPSTTAPGLAARTPSQKFKSPSMYLTSVMPLRRPLGCSVLSFQDHLCATILLAVLEECYPDASTITAAHIGTCA